MIIRNDERQVKVVEALREGPGQAEIKTIATSEDTLDHAKMYANITLKKGSGIGYHQHVGEAEIIMIDSGTALYNDDGNKTQLYEGDVTVCEDGHFHSITNMNDEDLTITALVIKK